MHFLLAAVEEPDTVVEVALDMLGLLVIAAGGLAIGAVASVAVSLIMMAMRRRNPAWNIVSKRLRAPQRFLFLLLGAGLAVLFATQTTVTGYDVAWRPLYVQIFTIVLVLVAAWLGTALTRAIEETVLFKFQGTEETAHARRVRTQMQVIRRITIVLIWSAAITGALMTFPAFRGIGTTFFASAGLASIVAGLALQSSLSNIFAGIQIAFTDSVRVGDVIVLDGETGTVEELTLTYVVMRVWDDRRIILPSTRFTTQQFENWTRRSANMLGTVIMEVDWFTPIPALRIELQRIVENTDLWDGRTCSMQVTDALDGKVTVRAVLSASSSGRLWDLRCHVREELVHWIQNEAPYSVPRRRIEPETTTAPPQAQRQAFIDRVEKAWEQERESEPEDEPAVPAKAKPEPAEEDSILGWLMGLDDARRARREAERADRRAAKEDPLRLSGHERVLPLPSADETRLFTPKELAEAQESEGGAARPVTRTAAAGPSHDAELPPERTPVRQLAQEAHAAESRLYSGSPDAEERARLLEGPEPAEMAEREETARRRLNLPPEERQLGPGEGAMANEHHQEESADD